MTFLVAASNKITNRNENVRGICRKEMCRKCLEEMGSHYIHENMVGHNCQVITSRKLELLACIHIL
jgi:hypothetical protein